MSVPRKCTVISLNDDPEMMYGPIYHGSCQNAATEQVDNQDIDAVNQKLRGEELVGNWICEEHAIKVGDI